MLKYKKNYLVILMDENLVKSNNSNNQETKKTREFNLEFRKKLNKKIEKIDNKVILTKIFDIVKEDKLSSYTENNNGIYFNINALSDKSIHKITNLINKYFDSFDNTESELKITYTKVEYDDDLTIDTNNHLNNQEKHILKKLKSIS